MVEGVICHEFRLGDMTRRTLGQKYHKGGSASAGHRGSTETDPTRVFDNHAFSKPEAEASPRVLSGSEEGFKDAVAVLLADAGAGIRHSHPNSWPAAVVGGGGIGERKPG